VVPAQETKLGHHPVFLRISLPQKICYRCLFLYDDAHLTIGCRDNQDGPTTPRAAVPKRNQKGEEKANRNCCQFTNRLNKLTTNNVTNPNSHSECLSEFTPASAQGQIASAKEAGSVLGGDGGLELLLEGEEVGVAGIKLEHGLEEV